MAFLVSGPDGASRAGLPWPRHLAEELGLSMIMAGLYHGRGCGRELTCRVPPAYRGSLSRRMISFRPQVVLPCVQWAGLRRLAPFHWALVWNGMLDTLPVDAATPSSKIQLRALLPLTNVV